MYVEFVMKPYTVGRGFIVELNASVSSILRLIITNNYDFCIVLRNYVRLHLL